MTNFKGLDDEMSSTWSHLMNIEYLWYKHGGESPCMMGFFFAFFAFKVGCLELGFRDYEIRCFSFFSFFSFAMFMMI